MARLLASSQITLSNIYDGYTVNLSNDNVDIVCNDNGDALTGELGANGRAITSTTVIAGSTKLTAVASNPTAGQYSITISAQVGCTAAKSGNDKVYINTLTGSVSGKVSISFNIEGTTTVVKDMTFIKKINETADSIDGRFSFGAAYWSNSQDGINALGSNVKVVKSSQAIYGDNLLEITRTTWVYSRRTIDIEKNKVYKCRFRAKQSVANTTGGKTAYFGYTPFDNTGRALGTDGAGNMYFKNEALKTTEWTEWEFYVSTTAKSEVSTFVNGVKKIISPTVVAFPTNTVKFRPMFIVNYNDGDGTALVDGWILEDVTDKFAISDIEYKASQIETTVNGIDANVTTIKTYTEMSSNPMTLVAKANYSAYDTFNQGEVYLHGLDSNRNPANVDGKCIWNKRTVTLPKVMFNPNSTVAAGVPVYMVRNISDNKWWSIWKETNNSTTVWKRASADVANNTTVYAHTWNEANDIVVGYYIIKKTNPRDGEAPIVTAQLFDGALNYKQAISMTLVGSISQLEILENELGLKVQKNNVIASINLYTQENENGASSGIKIRGDKIDLQGQVTFNSLADSNVAGSIKNIFTQQNNETVIDGGMIKTHSIKGNDLLLKGNLTVNDNSNNKTFEITSNGDVNIQAKSLRIGSANVATNNDINNAINNIEIGGRNIATETNRGVTGWSWGLQAGGKTISEVTENGIRCCKMTRDNVAATGWSYISYSRIGRNKYIPGKKYTVSFEVKSSIATDFWCYFLEGNSSNGMTTDGVKARVTEANKWTKLIFTVTMKNELPSSTSQLLYLNGMNSSVGVTYIFRNLMIEEGTKASAWSPAPEDIDNAISNKVDNNQEAIFNKLFANGQQGFALENGKVYINGEVIKTGTLDAGKITTGIMQASNGGSYLNLNNGSMMLGSTSMSNYLQWTGSALNIKANSISIGSGTVATNNDINNAINNIEIGGTNIIRGTNSITQLGNASSWNDGTWRGASGGTGTREVINITNAPNPDIKKGIKITMTSSSTGNTDIAQDNVPVMNGSTYTLSCYARVTSGSAKLRLQYGKSPYPVKITDVTNTTWKKFSYTFTIGKASDGSIGGSTNIYFGLAPGVVGSVEMCGFKLEGGAKATDWSPSPQDINTTIDNISIGGKNLMRYSSPELLNGLSVSDKWQSGRCTIKSDYLTSANDFDGKKAYWLTITTSTDGWAQLKTPSERLVIEPNTDYVVSFKSHIGNNCKGMRLVLFNSGDSKNQEIYRKTKGVTSSGVKNHDKVVFRNNLNEKAYLCIYNMGKADTASENVSNLLIGDIKIEKGNKATDWTAAPEDIDSVINSKVDNNQEAIFNKLFSNGQQGFELQNGKVYINGEVIKTGTLDASKIKAGVISASSGGSYLNLNNGSMMLGSTNMSNYLQWTGSALNIKASSISLGSGTVATNNDINNAINNVHFGGRNLIKQSKLLTNVSYSGWSILNTGNEGFKKLEIDTTSTDWQECSIPLYTEVNTLTKSVTISFEYQESTSGVLQFNFGVYNSSGGRIAELTNWEVKTFNVLATNGDWKYVCFTFDPNSLNNKTNANHYRVQFKKTNGKTGRIQIRKPMLEISTKASSWTPAPEDIESTVNRAIKTVDVMYYSSTSSSTVTGGSWQTLAPAWQKDRYIWTKTVTTYMNNTNSETTPVCISGVNGQNGTNGANGSNGKDGKGIKSIVEQYYLSTSNSSQAGGSWVTTPPAWANGKYMWTRSVVTYTDGSTTTTNPVCVSGSKGDTGATGATGVGISSIVEYYLVSTSSSGVTSSTSGWSTSIPTMTATNKYLWNYEVVHYTNNTSTQTTPKIIGVYGEKGSTGATGATGNGISTIVNYYLASASSSGVTTSTSGWTTTVQAVSNSTKYLWNYEKITYTNGSSTSTTPCIIGTYGDKGDKGATGAAGVGIKSVDVEYYLSTSSTSLSGGSWSTTAPAWANGKYMWSRTKTVTTAGTTTYSNAVCITGSKGSTGATGATGAQGPAGATGATGQGISSITEEYYLSTSKTTQTGGSWVTTPPTWSTGKYIWTRSKIVYKNPTSTVYTTPLCDSSWEAVNSVEIGGRNLAKKGCISRYNTGTDTTVTDTNFLRDGSATFSRKAVINEGPTIDRYTVYEVGREYVISFKLRTTAGTVNSIHVYNGCSHTNSSVYIDGVYKGTLAQDLAFPTDTNYHKVEVYFKAGNANRGDGSAINTVHTILQPMKGTASTYTVEILNFKIEKGNKPTDWSPAPEDIKTSIDNKVENNQQAIFNTLFNNGKQGVELTSDGKVYINGEIIKANTINGDRIKAGTLDASRITTGTLSANVIKGSAISAINLSSESAVISSAKIANLDASKITSGTIAAARIDANTIVSKVNGASTTISGDKIRTGVLQANSGGSYLNLNNGSMLLGSKSVSNYFEWTGSALNIKANAISIGTNSVATNNDVNNAVNNIQIGGRNLWKFTKDYDGTKYNGWLDNNEGSSKLIAPHTRINGFGVQRIAGAWIDISQRVEIEPNTMYTLSAWIKWESTAATMYFYTNTGTMSGTNVTSQVGTSAYKRVSVSFNSGNASISTCRFECSTNTPYLIYGLKFEKGSKATDWSPAPEDAESSITSLQNRVTTAESKITSNAIINTVQSTINNAKNEAINSANGSTDSKLKNYATTSSLTQTANNITASFKSSGGYNLIANSTGYNNTNLWTASGATLGTDINNNIGGATNKYMYLDNGTKTSESFAFSRRFKIKANTKYTLSGWFHNYTKCPNFDVFLLSSTSVAQSDTGTSYTNAQHLINAQSTSGSWKKYSVTFTTPANVISGYIRIDNNGYNASGTNSNRIHWSALMLNEGEEQPWSPHPDEAYAGIVKLDANGVEVSHTGANTTTHMNSKGFFIFNSQGETVGSLATETGLSIVNANQVYADNINTVYQGDANLYINHNHTGSNLGTSSDPFRSFADLKRHLESQPVINKNVTIYVKTTSEITEQLTLTGLSGSGWIWIYYDKTCVHRQVASGNYSIVLNNISNYFGIEGGRSNYNSSDGAVICDKWNAHGISITNCNNVYIGNINIHCQNWGIKVHRSRIRTRRVDFCGTWCCLDLSELSHGTDSDSCGGSSGGEFFRLYDGSIFLYGDTGGGYRPVGAKQENSGRYLLVGGERTPTNSFRTPPPAPSTSDQYASWSMTDYGYFSYGRNGMNVNKWNPGSKKIQQGEWSGLGNNYGFAFFNDSSIRSWLANGTPKDGSTVTIKRASEGGYSSSQPIYLHGATNTSCSGVPSGLKSYGNIGTLAWGETKTFNLPTAAVNDLKSGAIKSLCFYDSSGSSYVKLTAVSIKLKANRPV